MKVLILWSSLSDYMVASFKELVIQHGVELFWVYQPSKSNAPFKPFDLSFCTALYEDKSRSYEKLKKVTDGFEPDLIFMASWNFRHYMKLAKDYKKSGKIVVSSFDNQWRGTIKQFIGVITSKVFLKPVIDNFLVPSERQAIFSKKLGFKEPFQGFYCANTNNFHNVKSEVKIKSFVFVGRFVTDKSVEDLIEAYQLYRNLVEDPWSLRMIGKGPLESLCLNQDGVIVEGFSQPHELPETLAQNSCFILPSKFENWGLVIHEAALVGLPIICSSTCGASSWFVRDGQNGFLCLPEVESIKNALIKIHNTSSKKLSDMSDVSYNLGHIWTTQRWANHINETFNSLLSK